MNDLLLAVLWIGIFSGGLGACALLFELGVPRTYVRDVLHVGAGSWVLGWPFWSRPWPAIAIAAAGLTALLVLPRAASILPALAKVRDGVSGGDERWTGLTLYGGSFAVLTAVGLLHAPFPAAGALLALALGDGIGGAVGRNVGRCGHRYRAPGAKTKSAEGTVATAVGAAAGIALAAWWFGESPPPWHVAIAAISAAAAEAIAPRATDNLTIPDQPGGMLHPDDGWQAVLPCDHRAVGSCRAWETGQEVPSALIPDHLARPYGDNLRRVYRRRCDASRTVSSMVAPTRELRRPRCLTLRGGAPIVPRMPLVLAEELDRLIAALETARLDYALAGGLAVAVWGAPRATKDIDLLVRKEDLDTVQAVARACGFALEAEPMTFRDGMELHRMTKVHERDLLTLDLMLVNADLEEAWRSRQRVPTLRGDLWVVERRALIAMKLRAGRPQDVFDVERLRDLDR